MRSSGFTLIELLLVLAIIGIIAGIAIPALLSQRARSRDKASIQNVVGHLNDVVGQYDRLKEAGATTASISTGIRSYLTQTVGKDASPWVPTVTAMNPSPFVVTGVQSQSSFESGMSPSPYLGRGRVYIQYPTDTDPGYLGVIVQIRGMLAGNGNLVVKSVGIE